MPDTTYQPKVYRKPGGDTQVIASGGAIDVESGGKILDDGVQAGAVANVVAATPAAAPAGGTGTAAGGWDTAANRDSAITTINNLRTLVDEMKTKMDSMLAALRGAGILAP